MTLPWRSENIDHAMSFSARLDIRFVALAVWQHSSLRLLWGTVTAPDAMEVLYNPTPVF